MSSPSSPPSPGTVSARVRERLGALRSAQKEEVSPERASFRKAAALLSHFDPATLRPLDPDCRARDGVLILIDDCEVVGEPTLGVWRLKLDVRKETLRGIDGRDEALRAFTANRDKGHDDVERTVHAYLAGTAKPLESQGLEQLACTMQAVRWLREIRSLDGVPSVEEILAVQRRKQLLDPLETLVGDSFRGRESELDKLRLHVGVVDPALTTNRLRSTGQKLNPFKGGTRQPLMVHGPPGVGKSTLLAKLALEHSVAPGARVPFVFIDFERPTLSVVQPVTLLGEACRQLAVQFPAIAGELAKVEEDAAREARRQRDATVDVAELQEVSTARATVHREAVQAAREEAAKHERALIGALSDALGRDPAIGADPKRRPPLLFVLDSFEQAQYRSSPYLRRLWQTFAAFQTAYPRIRVVVSGRAPVKQLAINRRNPKYLPVSEFDEAAATGFLIDEGVTDEVVAAELAQRFGGNPLSLKLTARLAIRHGMSSGWASEVATKEHLFFKIASEQIQTRLYSRLLKSINEPDIEALAHPGMVLRRITPAIIKDVLAGPCKVEVPDLARADELFDEFECQVDLVQPEGTRVLSHRPDLRRDMLPLIVEDKPVEVEQVERLAVAFYRDQEGPAARAEEIYHRLRLGDPPSEVDEAWEPGVGDFLGDAQAEMPARAHAYLAAKLADARVPPEVLADADFRDWETLTAREVEDLLDQEGDEPMRRSAAAEALELMRAREGWSPGSPLYRLQAEALSIVGDQQTAEVAVSAGISAITDEPTRTASLSSTLLDLLLLGARLAQGRGEDRGADERLEEAERLAQRLGRGLDVVSTLLYRVRLHAGLADDHAVRERAARRFLDLDDDELREQPALVRSAAVELGAENADVLTRAVDVLGVRVAGEKQRSALVGHLERLMAEDPELAAWLDQFARERGVLLRGDGEGADALIERLSTTDRLPELARVLVARSEDGSDLRRLLIDLLPETAADSLLKGDLGPALS